MSEQNKWVGGIAIAIVVLFGLWWLSASQSVGTLGATQSPATTSSTGNNAAQQVRNTKPVAIIKESADVVSIAKSISNGTEFAELLASTGVGTGIKAGGQYTIFVPTDGAFTRLAPHTVSALSSAGLKRLVEYHIVVGSAIDPSAVVSGSVQALSKDALNFMVAPDGTPRVGSAKILKAIKGSNGYVYLIDAVLLPPQK